MYACNSIASYLHLSFLRFYPDHSWGCMEVSKQSDSPWDTSLYQVDLHKTCTVETNLYWTINWHIHINKYKKKFIIVSFSLII